MCPLDYKSQSYHIQSSQISSVFKDHAISKIWNENYRLLILETQTDRQTDDRESSQRQTDRAKAARKTNAVHDILGPGEMTSCLPSPDVDTISI